ncbi:hypothetical protein [Deinococcus sp.]|uniref:hypothetical protein n=1 Tax=Deinococcus sp. TaxID=47478 RepID=UPI003C7EABE6
MNDGPPDDASVVSMLTTEHFTLQTARSATISEATGRSGTYLSSVSGGLVALSLLANVSKLGPAFVLAGFAVGVTLLLLGLTTFQRLLEVGIEDVRYGQGIARIRRSYLERAPHLRSVLIQSEHDDLRSVMSNMGIESGPAQLLVTGASGVAVVNSALTAALAGGAVAGLNWPMGWIFALTLLVGVASMWAHLRYQRRFWARFEVWSVPQFPASV